MTTLSPEFISLPKAELHVHLEGTMQPATLCALAARHNVPLTEEEVRRKYAYQTFREFLNAFKWATSLLREPQDYALIADAFFQQLLSENICYAEITLSVGVMLLRNQNPVANFEALCRSAEPYEKRGLRIRWIFDAVRQFGVDAALRVVEAARSCASPAIVAFGLGGDELSLPAKDFRAIYDAAAALGLHRLIHAGETGGPQNIRDAIELLGAERIGHGIAAIHDPALMDLLAERRIPLEICPSSNLRTGALALQLARADVLLKDHPVATLHRRGVPVVLSSDDPAMFHTTLLNEYENTAQAGLSETDLRDILQASFTHAFANSSDNPPR